MFKLIMTDNDWFWLIMTDIDQTLGQFVTDPDKGSVLADHDTSKKQVGNVVGSIINKVYYQILIRNFNQGL